MTYNVSSGTLSLYTTDDIDSVLLTTLSLYIAVCCRTTRWCDLKRTSSRRKTSLRNFQTVARHTESLVKRT